MNRRAWLDGTDVASEAIEASALTGRVRFARSESSPNHEDAIYTPIQTRGDIDAR
jgi:hypothetical protein